MPLQELAQWPRSAPCFYSFIKDRGDLSSHYQECLVSVSLTRSKVQETERKTLTQMLLRFSVDELKEMVKSGAVTMRKHPKCAKVIQFQDVTEKASSVLSWKKDNKATPRVR